ncbi:PAS domain S-box-containing protein/diguanylate cyclase (GGDEF)-like protein [Sphingomonas sp. PP-F2F-A104-K0414]|uniref:GGDEF and EAL domain-containing protein n=1 Tax=Sphingomonas sp. PP-F2F-A104-K0414 TaxID=2135661 RepID=UPI0010CF4A39|nr:GGDEF and EAL domain-containing protein [Sphingomonas sp. PP-F2F-A104-K0414]TCP98721.1 PAS domain S-box-containing protein/diguanylate cyclase (GGDEF)-like protein [Sphingomonas sp. PP-F2F-A104-K0414]
MPSALAILDMLPGLVAYFDRDLTYRYANATYAAWRGIAPDQIVGRHCREIVGEGNFPTVLPRLTEALAGTPVTYEYTLFDGGDARRVQGSYVPDVDADGVIRGVVVLVTDISVRRDLEARIAEKEIMFNDAFEHAPVGMAVTNADGRMERVNAAFAAMLGLTVVQLAGLDFRTITHPDDQEADARLFAEVVAGGRDDYTLEKRYIHKNGEPVHASLAVSAVRAPDGALIRVIAHIQDVTERRRADRALQEINARMTLAMEAVRGGFWHIDVETKRFETSPSFSRFVRGPERSGPIDLDTYGDYIAPANRDAASVQTLLDGEIDNASVEYELSTINGPRWMRCDRKLLRAADGSPLRIVGVTIDISEDRERQLRAVVAAETDPLTGLLNRRGLDQRLAQTSPGVAVGIIAIDLDRFKAINDRFGHSVGDTVLVEVARRLRRAVRASDHLARLGGDEFAVLLPDADDARLSVVANRIERALCERMTSDGITLPVGGSVGAVLMDGSTTSSAVQNFAAAWGRADAALYAAKRDRTARSIRLV